MKKLITIVLLICHWSLQAQTTKDSADTVLQIAEQMPEFPGGVESMMRFISDNLRYPPAAVENGVQGRVIASFVVNTDGSLSDIRILKRLGWGCDEEVERVLLIMPQWRPGIQNGKTVRVQFNLPVAFKLQGEDTTQATESFIGAHFKGGETALAQYLSENLRYPKKAQKEQVQGVVMAKAVIDAKGRVKDVEILKPLHSACDKEAVRLIKSLPAFQPAIRNKEAVESAYFISVRFRLPEDKNKCLG
jgi:TonB family protein